MNDKTSKASAFINKIRAMNSKDLNDLILNDAGDELSQFFVNYAGNLINQNPERVLDNCSALMLMGYLIAKEEEKRNSLKKSYTVFGQIAQA